MSRAPVPVRPAATPAGDGGHARVCAAGASGLPRSGARPRACSRRGRQAGGRPRASCSLAQRAAGRGPAAGVVFACKNGRQAGGRPRAARTPTRSTAATTAGRAAAAPGSAAGGYSARAAHLAALRGAHTLVEGGADAARPFVAVLETTVLGSAAAAAVAARAYDVVAEVNAAREGAAGGLRVGVVFACATGGPADYGAVVGDVASQARTHAWRASYKLFCVL